MTSKVDIFFFLAQIVNRCERSQNADARAFPNAPHSSLSNHHKLTHGRGSTELKASRLPNAATPGLAWCIFSLSSVGPGPPRHTHTTAQCRSSFSPTISPRSLSILLGFFLLLKTESVKLCLRKYNMGQGGGSVGQVVTMQTHRLKFALSKTM